jgi:hypothetical protein
MLRSVVDRDALELAQLAAIRFPGDPEVEQTNEMPIPIPDEPEVTDPSAVKHAPVRGSGQSNRSWYRSAGRGT